MREARVAAGGVGDVQLVQCECEAVQSCDCGSASFVASFLTFQGEVVVGRVLPGSATVVCIGTSIP